MDHKVIITTGGEFKDSYERGTITYISKHSDSVVAKYSIWSDQEIEDETLDNLNYYVFLETLPEIETLQGLENETVSAIIDDGLESFPLDDLLENGDVVAQQIYLSNKHDQPITLEIPKQQSRISANTVLVDHLVCDIALRDVTEGITKTDLLDLAKLIHEDWDIFNDASVNFLKEIVIDFLTQVTFTKDEIVHIRNLQRALLMNDNATMVSSSFLYKDARISFQCTVLVSEENENNKHYYRLYLNDYKRQECEIIKYAKTLAEINTFFDHYVQNAGNIGENQNKAI